MTDRLREANVLREIGVQEVLHAAPDGETAKKHGSSFFRGETRNFNPYLSDHAKADFAGHFILKGWLPPGPFIGPETQVTAFGSCFAENISSHLASIGYSTSKQRDQNVYVSSMGDGLVNVHAIVQQFKWALEDWQPPSDLWHGYDAEAYDLSEEIRRKTRALFLSTDVFILTFGLSEIWYDEVTGGVFWRAVPMQHYDASRHKFRVCSFAETKACVQEIIELIKQHVPAAKLVMTVSPIPLICTFRPVSSITANASSKAIIRAALDEVFREMTPVLREDVYYFPAFELVNDCFPNRFNEDARHLQNMVVPSVMRLFEAYFCETDLTPEEAEYSFQEARLLNARTMAAHPLFGRTLAER